MLRSITLQLQNFHPDVNRYAFFNKQIKNIAAKQGSMLSKMVTNKDKRKNWHLTAMSEAPKGRKIFDKVHRPSKRQSVLNSLFITNITDVLSTGDVMPELMGYGIEITGVKVSSDYQIVNIFWQTPPSAFEASKNIETLLSMNAPKIRAELISRNVLGRVPLIYFVRDRTNAKVAAFEEALKQVDIEFLDESPVVPDAGFVEDLYVFKDAKASEPKYKTDVPAVVKQKTICDILEKPPDMKTDVFGLDHRLLMSKVLAVKKKPNEPQLHSAVISPESLESGDLFSKIPGTVLQTDNERDKLLKQFCIERKILLSKKFSMKDGDNILCQEESEETEPVEEYELEQDFIDEETVEKF